MSESDRKWSYRMVNETDALKFIKKCEEVNSMDYEPVGSMSSHRLKNGGSKYTMLFRKPAVSTGFSYEERQREQIKVFLERIDNSLTRIEESL